MASVGSGTLTSIGSSSPWYDLTGPNLVWRGATISSSIAIEFQDKGNTDPLLVRRTGTVLHAEGAVTINASYDGTISYRLICLTLPDGGGVAWAISK